METVLLPTTKAQVSGRKFLMRRVEHGVVLGDIRMISDPLGARRRATMFGLVAAVLIGLGSGAMALFRPQINPGDAPIVVADSGAIFVRISHEGQFSMHPVANLASARLIVGAAEKPAKVSDTVLAQLPHGTPLGIVDAPGVIAPHPQPSLHWGVCHDGKDVLVTASSSTPTPLLDAQAVLAEAEGKQWLITSQGRGLLPPANEPLGKSLRRRLGITPETKTWRPPAEVLSAVREVPPYSLPSTNEMWKVENERWLKTQDGVVLLEEVQAAVLADMGAKEKEVKRTDLNAHPLVMNTVRLPTQLPEFQDRPVICAHNDTGDVSLSEEMPMPGIELSGKSVATKFSGLPAGSVGVDTGHGWVLVSEYGVVHRLPNQVDVTALGISDPRPAPWNVLRLLPEGTVLERREAVRTLY